MVNAAELYKQFHEQFLADRAKQEMQVLAWAEELRSVDKSIFEGKVEIPEELTLRSLMPELYEDCPRQEVYDEQFRKTTEFINKVNAVIEEVNNKAIETLKEYQQFAEIK